MIDSFRFAQANDQTVQIARVQVPGCGRKERDDAPVILIENDGGNITLFVYADILASVPTHEISLNGALLSKKTKEEPHG
jgi:hypothetical protein